MVNVLNFDEYGHLTPYDIIETNLETLHSTFVFNPHRERLFENYLAFIDDLKRLELGAFFQWIDGSFTTRKAFPKDIDVITFLDINIYKSKKSRLHHLILELSKIDGYFVEMYPIKHPLYPRNEWEKSHWKEIYGSTKDDGLMPILKKGITQINFF